MAEGDKVVLADFPCCLNESGADNHLQCSVVLSYVTTNCNCFLKSKADNIFI